MMMLSLIAALVILPTQLEVPEGPLSAADLVGESAVSVGDVHRMRSVGLGRAPAAGQMRRLAGPYLRRLLRAAGVTKIRVPAQIKLIGISEIITADQQLKAIRALVKRRLGKRGRIIELRAHQNLTDVKVPPGSRIARLSPVGGNPFARRVTFKLEIERRGRLVSTRYPQVEVVGKARVIIATRSLPAKHLVSAADFHSEERDLSQVPKSSLGRFPIIGMLTARRISAGRALRRDYFKSPPVVHRGQRIRIELRGAMLSVSTVGEALGEAAVGQTVAVRNLNSGRRLSGVVRAPGLVEVTP